MTELETMQFYKILEMVQRDLAHLGTYERDFERVRTAADSAVLHNDIFQYNNIMERIHYLCIHITQNLSIHEDMITERRTWEHTRVKDRGDYT